MQQAIPLTPNLRSTLYFPCVVLYYHIVPGPLHMDGTLIPQTHQVHNQTIHLPPNPQIYAFSLTNSDNDSNILQGYKSQ